MYHIGSTIDLIISNMNLLQGFWHIIPYYKQYIFIKTRTHFKDSTRKNNFREKQKNYYLIVLFKQVVLTHFYFFGFISQLGWMKSFGFCFWHSKILNFERQVYKKLSNNERIIKRRQNKLNQHPKPNWQSFSKPNKN